MCIDPEVTDPEVTDPPSPPWAVPPATPRSLAAIRGSAAAVHPPSPVPPPSHPSLPFRPPAASCGYGYLDPRVKTGWDVAALTDTAGDFAGSCGRCYEVACLPLVREGEGPV